MMRKILVFLFAVCALSAARSGVVEWTFPRLGSCHEGLPFSDGVTGVLVWGGGDTINLTVGRADLWDHRGGYPWLKSQSYTNIVSLVRAGRKDELLSLFRNDPPANWGGRYNPYMLPLGRVKVVLSGATLARGELDTATGLGTLILADGREIGLAMSKSQGVFAMKIPEGLDYFPFVHPATDFPIYEQTLKGRGFKRAKQTSSLAFTWELPADKPVSLECENCPLSARGRTLYVWTNRGESSPRPKLASFGFDGIAADSRAYWSAFWKKGARVKVPDETIQRIFDYGMYRFGAMTDPDGVPAGLQGPWLEDDKLVPWNGDYHFNINVQECYSPAFRGGHFKHLMPLFKMVLSWRPLLRENARQFVGIGDGYVLPHSVDDRGVCIGGFWTGTIDHGSTAWVAAMMYRYVKYSGDTAFLRSDAYDFMKGAMNVYRAMMEEKDGRLSIPLGPSPEWGGSDVRSAVGRDPSFQLAAAHRLARDLIDAAKRLGETPDAMWLDVERRLPQYVAGDCGIRLFEGQDLVESHRHHSHMAGLYPFDTIDFSTGKARDDVRNTYAHWTCKGCGLWSGWCVPWASILRTHIGHPEAAIDLLHAWDRYYCNPGHGSCHDAQTPGFSIMMGRDVMQMDGQCAAATAVMELLVHEVNGKVEYFRGCPSDWKDVSFENIRLSDGTSVSGRRINGEVKIAAH